MVTKVQKWGNSQGLRLSKELLSDARFTWAMRSMSPCAMASSS